MNRGPFGVGEWYHCFNRGVDKRKVFLQKYDYERFLMLLYCANDVTPVHLGEFRQGSTLAELWAKEQVQPLVDISVYSLMPNHFHLLLREISEGGISLFMQKLGTGYTGYFNKKENRTGALFAGRFKSKHVADDRYLKRVANYIHANSAELIESRWKEGVVANQKATFDFLKEYRYSSLPDYQNTKRRPEEAILNRGSLLDCYDDIETLSTRTLLSDAQDFARTEKTF